MSTLPLRIWHLYRDGFRSMTLGRTLWGLILFKLFIMFGVLKMFFFPDLLHTRYDTDAQRSGHVLDRLTADPATLPDSHRR